MTIVKNNERRIKYGAVVYVEKTGERGSRGKKFGHRRIGRIGCVYAVKGRKGRGGGMEEWTIGRGEGSDRWEGRGRSIAAIYRG